MNAPILKDLEEMRPKIIPSLRAGFDAVASHIWLILPPVLIDLIIWLGPHLRVQSLLQPFLKTMEELPLPQTTAQMQESIAAAQQIWTLIAERFNLTMALRSYPIGVPSLMSNWLPLTNPLGKPLFIEVNGLANAIGWWIILGLVGLMIGSLFFSLIAQVTAKEKISLAAGELGWNTLQALLMVISILVAVGMLAIPALMIIGALTLVSPMLGQLALFMGGLLLIWLIVPLIFTPHGIFSLRVPFVKALGTSVQVVRFTYSGTGLFLLVLVIISQGLDLLWQVPAENSWLAAVGILGHAFVNTGILAASFIYYRDGLRFVQGIINRTQQLQQSMSNSVKS